MDFLDCWWGHGTAVTSDHLCGFSRCRTTEAGRQSFVQISRWNSVWKVKPRWGCSSCCIERFTTCHLRVGTRLSGEPLGLDFGKSELCFLTLWFFFLIDALWKLILGNRSSLSSVQRKRAVHQWENETFILLSTHAGCAWEGRNLPKGGRS